VSTGFLKGRPYGGTANFIKNSLIDKVKEVITQDRVVALLLCDTLFFNVYLPCEDGSTEAWNMLHEILANFADII